jgi:hypothetical protein
MSVIRTDVREVGLDDPDAFFTDDQGTRRQMALSLREQLAVTGGKWVFTVPHRSPTDNKVHPVQVDLRPWKGRDLDNTYLLVTTGESFTEEEANRIKW